MLLRAVFTFCILVSPVPCAGFVLNAVPDSPPSNLPYYIVWGIAIIAIAIKVRKPSP